MSIERKDFLSRIDDVPQVLAARQRSPDCIKPMLPLWLLMLPTQESQEGMVANRRTWKLGADKSDLGGLRVRETGV